MIDISIAIPVYSMKNKGVEMLRRCLDSIRSQTFKPFEVVVSDNTTGEMGVRMKELIEEYKDLNIVYFYNPRTGIGANTNEAIKRCKAEYIKILYQDDYFAHENALRVISESINGEWLVSGCSNNPNPVYTGDIHLGNNKIGAPSVLTIKNYMPLMFNEELSWLLDCDYYKRMYSAYGEPTYLNDLNVIIGTGEHQMTNILTNEEKKAEVELMREKYV